VIHRALRPESILVDADDKVKLIDFGYAADVTARRLTYTNLTADLGNPDYISPEQVQGKRGDGRSDIYAMGVILYEMLTGKLPFTGSSPREVMNNRLLNHPIPPSVAEPSISPQFQEVLYRALERDPKNRYARPQDFARDLQHLDKIGVADRAELRDWRKRTGHMTSRIVMYVVLSMIPVAILIAMVLFSRAK
jgi:serine/threonine-protein kinase